MNHQVETIRRELEKLLEGVQLERVDLKLTTLDKDVEEFAKSFNLISSLKPCSDDSFESPSGVAFGPEGKFYVNSREGLQTISYDVVVNVNGIMSAQTAEVFTEYKDQPLGLLWVPIE